MEQPEVVMIGLGYIGLPLDIQNEFLRIAMETVRI